MGAIFALCYRPDVSVGCLTGGLTHPLLPSSLASHPLNRPTCACRVHTPANMPMPGDISEACNTTTVLRGTLPREPVCTENLIPLIKMLPCRSKVNRFWVLCLVLF